MYNTHRGMVSAPNSRLSELLDQLRQEFENQSRSTGEFEHQCAFLSQVSSVLQYSRQGRQCMPIQVRVGSLMVILFANPINFPFLVTGQLQEMEMIRQKVYQLEQAQVKMKQELVPLMSADLSHEAY